MSRKPQPIYRCTCGYWERRNGATVAPGCKWCTVTLTRHGHIAKGKSNNTAPRPMSEAVRVEPEPTEAWGTAWEDL